MRIFYFIPLILLTACGPSLEEKQNIATITCNIMGESRNMDASMRIKEINIAREKIKEEPYLMGDAEIKESFEYGLCEELVLADPEYKNKMLSIKEAIRVVEEQKREEARIAREKKEEEARIAREKKEEEARIAAEEARIAAEEARIVREKEAADATKLYRVAAANELSKYKIYRGGRLTIDMDDGDIDFGIRIVSSGMISEFKDYLIIIYDSLIIDFINPELTDFEIRSGSGLIDSVSTGITIGGAFLKKLKNGLVEDEETIYFRDIKLSRSERNKFKELFNSKSSYGSEEVLIPDDAYKVTLSVIGLRTLEQEPYDFECGAFWDDCFMNHIDFEPIIFTIDRQD